MILGLIVTLGTLSFGEGGGEIAKQLLNQTYDIVMPKIIAVVLDFLQSLHHLLI